MTSNLGRIMLIVMNSNGLIGEKISGPALAAIGAVGGGRKASTSDHLDEFEQNKPTIG